MSMNICVKHLLLIWLPLLLTVTIGSEIPKMNFRRHFDALSEKRNPNYENGIYWKRAREYVKIRFQEYGLRVIEEHVFNTTISDKHVEGVNLIGVVEGSDLLGPVMVIGADYDSTTVGNQLKDNAGGVACLLETIHVFMDRILWNPYHLNYTVIFVAFDLNTKEYLKEGNGQSGSYMFLHEWLLPYLNNATKLGRTKEFRGAIILDSVTTYNTQNGTQHFPDGFAEGFPTAFKDISATDNRGDFIGLLYLSKQAKNPIKEEFVKNYNVDYKRRREFRLQEMEFLLNVATVTSDVLDFVNHQAQYHFWTNTKNPMPAFLLFDTDSYRVDPTPTACSKATCSVDDFLTTEREEFMKKTTDTIIATLLGLQTTQYEIINASNLQRSSVHVLATSVVFALAFFKTWHD